MWDVWSKAKALLPNSESDFLIGITTASAERVELGWKGVVNSNIVSKICFEFAVLENSFLNKATE